MEATEMSQATWFRAQVKGLLAKIQGTIPEPDTDGDYPIRGDHGHGWVGPAVDQWLATGSLALCAGGNRHSTQGRRAG